MEANAKKPKAKARPKLNPTENAALKRLEHDLITDDGIVPATKGRHAIHCLTVIGTIEGHTLSPDAQKTTKYEHVIPQLVDIEEDPEIEGLLVILNTVGGDVEAGLALAELIAGVSKPSATLVLGGGHSIGNPAGRRGAAQLYCTHRDNDGPSGTPLRHGAGRAADAALF